MLGQNTLEHGKGDSLLYPRLFTEGDRKVTLHPRLTDIRELGEYPKL